MIAQRQAQSAELTTLLGVRDDARAELARLESDVALVDARAARDTERLAATSNVKEAQGLEHELVSLAKRKSDLEDAELVIMERLETAEAAVAQQEAAIAEINAEGARLSAEGKAALAEMPLVEPIASVTPASSPSRASSSRARRPAPAPSSRWARPC